MNDSNIEYKAEGVVVADDAPEEQAKKVRRHNSRSIVLKSSPKIYVNDGSNGTNLVDTYSYKNYCDAHEKPSKENHYMNHFKTTLTSNPQYVAVDGLRLHPTADSGGYSNFTISQFKMH